MCSHAEIRIRTLRRVMPGIEGVEVGVGTFTRPIERTLSTRLLSPRIIPLAHALVTFLVFLPALWNDFVEWDDQVTLTGNQEYRGLTWPHIRWMFTTVLLGHWIPLTWLTFGLDFVIWGMKPAGYHLTSLVIFAANASVFYVVALRLLRLAAGFTGSALRVSAVAATLFFAVHPLRAESVGWATERRDVLSGLFFLLTVLMYLKACGEGGRPRGGGSQRRSACTASLSSRREASWCSRWRSSCLTSTPSAGSAGAGGSGRQRRRAPCGSEKFLFWVLGFRGGASPTTRRKRKSFSRPPR